MNVENILKENNALLTGHFKLSSGLHSDRYLQMALVLAHPERAQELGKALAAKAPAKPDLIISPAMGGLIIGHEVARALGLRHYFTERVDGVMTLRRGFTLRPNEPVVVVEDVVTTGKSTREVFDVIRAAGAVPVGGLCVVDRSGGAAELGAPLASLWAAAIQTWAPEDCPQCRAGVPAIKPGSRTEAKNVR